MTHLNDKVLILNKSWIPIRVKTVKESIKVIYRLRASIVNPIDYSVYNWLEWTKLDVKDGENFIQTSRNRIKVPEVVVLGQYNKIPHYNVRLSKKNIFVRDLQRCQYSGKVLSRKDADIDHVVPKSKGGKTTWDNLVVCSKQINREKANKSVKEAGLELLRKPYKPQYHPIITDPNEEYPKSWEKFIKIRV